MNTTIPSVPLFITDILTVNIYINYFCDPLIFFNGFCMFSLSMVWSVHLLYTLMKDHRILKNAKKTQNSMCEHVFNKILKEATIRRSRNLFFLFVCLIEGLLFIIFLIMLVQDLRVRGTKDMNIFKGGIKGIVYNSPFVFTHQFQHSLSSVWLRIAIFFFHLSIYCIITLVRLLTEYMCSVYGYFETKPFLLAKLLLSFGIVSIIGFIAIFRQLEPFARLAISIGVIYQFILLFISTKKLRRLLYKRLFDAQNFESQAFYKINYFKRVFWNYKYASALLLISLFLQVIGFSVLSIHPIIMMSVYWPHKWLDAILYGLQLHEFYYPIPRAYDLIIASITQLLLTLGTALQILPFILVSIRLGYISTKNHIFRKDVVMNQNFIKAQLRRNNNAYLRNHFS